MLREVSEEDLKRILAAHDTWLETGGEKGEHADLSRTDLQGADLRSANFQEADLSGAKLRLSGSYNEPVVGRTLGLETWPACR